MILSLLAQASSSSSPAPAGGAGSFLILIPLFGLLYFMMIRPQKKARAAQMALTRSVEVGDEIETIAGMFGRITKADDATLWVELAPGFTVKMSRAAIRRKVIPDVAEGA
jgi:preprotein translocase subunit YajC